MGSPMSGAEDIRMLRAVQQAAYEWDDERTEAMESTLAAFAEMLYKLEHGQRSELTPKQRDWLKGVYEDVCGDPQYRNDWSAGRVPEGRPVETPAVLRSLPLKPPSRPKVDE